MENLIENLKIFGFNSYEAKVYLALLKKDMSTGYEISQIADIPQSRAYDALKSLEMENIVYSANSEKPLRYSPISPKELTKRFKRKMNSSLSYLDKKLPDIKSDLLEPINHIIGYENIIEQAKEIINNTSYSLYLELWAAEYKELEQTLSDAYDRGVNIKIAGYDNLKTMYGILFSHVDALEKEANAGGRLIFLLSDNEECLFGRVEDKAVWTNNKDIAYLLKEFICHDMYLIDVSEKFPEQLKYFYGSGLKKLKDKIQDKRSVYKI